MTALPDFKSWTTQELGYFIHDLRMQIVAYEARLEDPSQPRRRTIKLVRGTFLTAGGLLGAAIEPFAIILTIVGFWDWFDAIQDDAATMNQQMQYRRVIAELKIQLDMANTELDRRIAEGRPE